MRRLFCLLLALSAGATPNEVARAVVLSPGDILVPSVALSSDDEPAIVKVDPATGDRSVVSGRGIGSGVELGDPGGIWLLEDHTLYVADFGNDAILKVNLSDGSRAVVSGMGVGGGPAFANPLGLWMESSASLLVLDGQASAVIRVDAKTGERTLVSSAARGSGPDFVRPARVMADAAGNIYVTNAGFPDSEIYGSIYRVDALTGDRTILSDASHGGGPAFITVNGITRTGGGDMYVTDNWNARVYRIDAATGDRTLVTDGLDSTPDFLSPYAIIEGLDGSLLLTDVNYGEVYRTDPATGSVSYVSNAAFGIGAGPEFTWPLGIAVVRVAEPSTTALGACGLAALAAMRGLSRRRGTYLVPLRGGLRRLAT